ncbi:MAG: hypothetical protein AAGA71_22270 [Pseudomonadota bacterium]
MTDGDSSSRFDHYRERPLDAVARRIRLGDRVSGPELAAAIGTFDDTTLPKEVREMVCEILEHWNSRKPGPKPMPADAKRGEQIELRFWYRVFKAHLDGDPCDDPELARLIEDQLEAIGTDHPKHEQAAMLTSFMVYGNSGHYRSAQNKISARSSPGQ